MEKPACPPNQRALDCRRKAAEIRERAKVRSSRVLAEAEEQAQALELAAQVFESEASGIDTTPFRTRPQHATVRSMEKEHRLNLSAAHSSTKLAAAARAAGYSINDLAKLPAVNSKDTTLRAGHNGRRSIPESLCLRVQHALGKDEKGEWRLAATTENWPKMRVGK